MACRRICTRCAFPVDRRYKVCRSCGSRVSMLSSAGDKHWLYSVIGQVLMWHLMKRGMSMPEAWQYLIVRAEWKRMARRVARPLPEPFGRWVISWDGDGREARRRHEDVEQDWFW